MDNSLKAYSPDMNLIQVLNKNWNECTDAERITKLREECRELGHLTNRIIEFEIKLRKLENHSHQ